MVEREICTESGLAAGPEPADGAEIVILPGNFSQKVICRVVGNTENGRLWWFVDGVAKGRTVGAQPFVYDPVPGGHTISCSTDKGVSASTHISVKAEGE